MIKLQLLVIHSFILKYVLEVRVLNRLEMCSSKRILTKAFKKQATFMQGTLKIEGRTTHKFVYTRLLKFLLYSRAIQIDPCCSVQALYR